MRFVICDLRFSGFRTPGHRPSAIGHEKYVILSLLLATATLAGEVSLLDHFDGAGTVEWQVVQGDWQVREGLYHVSGSGQTYVSPAVFDDVTVEVDCRITDYGAIPADWVGIIVGGNRRLAGLPGYTVYLRYSGPVELYTQGQILAAQPTDAQARFEAGEFVHLTVAVQGQHFTVQVDGEKRIEYDAPDYRGGSVGLASYDVEGDFDNLKLQGHTLGNLIRGEVLLLPSYQPVPGAAVEIYHSMDGYNSPVTRQTVTDEQGRFEFRDLPAGEKAYWLRTGQEGFGGTTGWFVSVSDAAPTTQELYLVGAPRHDIWVDSADLKRSNGFRLVEDLQCFGGSRIEVKETRPAGERPAWWAEFEFETPHEADYVPYFAAGLYPTPHYWSDFWWSIDRAGPFQASRTLTLEGPRYGDRSTNVWAYGPLQRLKAGRHILKLLLRDPAPHGPTEGPLPYWWSFDAAALAEMPSPVSPLGGEKVSTARPTLRWRVPQSADRFTVQYSQEPDFSHATVTVGGVTGDHWALAQPLADGTYYWRVKALPAQDSPFSSPFSRPESFVVATDAPAISHVRVASRSPHEAVIEWRTDEPCACALNYGLSALAFTRSAEASTRPRRNHRVRLTGLEPMTYYYYAVQATDRDGHQVSSLRRGFCTPRGPIEDQNSPFGIFGQGLVYAKQMGEAGARWYSDYWDWGTLEPSRGTFHWEQAEARLRRAAEAGVNLLVTFWGTPAWVRPSHPTQFTYGPDDLQDARDFFREVAAHGRGRVDWWLPWIEPNVARDTTFGFPEGYWANRPHARSYAAYQRAAYEGAKAGNPDCRVVGMNTAGVDLDFIRRCYDEGAADSFDVMNVHYYAPAAPFEAQQPEQVFQNLRALMAEYGDAEKPILCSEGGGASSGLPGTNEDTQADHLIRIFVISIANHIDKLCWTFELDEKPYGSQRVDMIMWMGLFRFDPRTTPDNPVGEPKPSYFALRTLTENLYRTEYVGPVDLGPGVRVYRFEGKDRRVTVAWAEKGEREVALPVEAEQVTVIHRRGETQKVSTPGGRLRFQLTESPVFVREEVL